MAAKAGMSHTTVGRIWRTFGLQAARHAVVQDLARSAAHRQGAGRRRPVHEPAAQCGGVLPFDEKSQIQALERAQPILPMDLGPARATDAQLHPPRHARPLRRAERRHWRGPRALQAAASRAGFRRVPARDRCERRARTGGPRGAGQPLGAQGAGRASLVAPSSALPLPLHADLRVVAEPGGTVLWAADREGAQARLSHEHPATPRRRSSRTSTRTTSSGKPFQWTKTADEILDKMRRFGLRTQQVHGAVSRLLLEITDPGD